MKTQQTTEPTPAISRSDNHAHLWWWHMVICTALFTLLALTAFPVRAAGLPNQLEMSLHGQPNAIYLIEASTDLQHWTVIATNRSNPIGVLGFHDPQAGQFPHRYYRGMQMTGTVSGQGLPGETYDSGKILVKPKPGISLGRLNLSLGVSVLRVYPAIGNLQVIKVPLNETASTVITLYQQSGLVQYAEHDFYVQALTEPNDTHYVNGDLWNLNNLGQYNGTPGADIHATNAWSVITDASSVIVADVDTGVRYTHEDLAANMWVNPVDGSHGTNAVAGTTDPNDDYGHGTHVAGTIGAAGNNGLGIVGVCWRVQIMACKFLDANGNGTIDAAIACIDFARTHGARIINASWGATTFTSQALHDAIASARDTDIIFVAAAGNSAADNDTTPLYPASYRDLDNVVAVAATDRNDLLAPFSDYGTNSVDLAAPGTPIMSCWNGSDSDYQNDDGTSMSCAHVSGACALLRAKYPSETYRQIINRILTGTDPLPSLQGKTITGGRLDVAKALGATNAPPPLTANFSANPTSGQTPLSVQFTDTSTGNPTSWNWNFGDGSTGTAQNPSHTFNSAGNFTVTLTVANSTGQTSSKSSTITATNATQTTVTANFSASPTSGQAPLTVQFTDQSTGPVTGWNWNFGDGSTSTTQSPSHTYSSAGSFSATLTVTGSSGQSSSTSHTITVTNAVSPVSASFSANPSSGLAPLAVQFTDQSSGPVTAWNWNFGDGSTSTTQNPSHTYGSAGSFTATLTVSGSGSQTSSTSHTITVTNAVTPVSASFTANPASGQEPLAVQFTDQSTGPVTAWSWSFGDGSTGTTQNPSHTYNSAGSFTATLTVSGSSGQTSSTSHTITVTNAVTPVSASFSANPNSGQAPLAVQFTDQSTGPVTGWNWNFGDGSSSTAQNPSHTYSSAGSFTVALTVTGSSGQTSSTSHTITVTNAPPPSTVTVVASQSLATSLTPGVFTLTRNGSTGSQLTINYSLGGTAVNGINYQQLSGSVVFPAGSATTTVVIQPEGLLTVLRTVVLTLSPNSNYQVGSPGSATVTIAVSLSLK